MEIVPDSVAGRLRPVKFDRTTLYSDGLNFYMKLHLDPFGFHSEGREIQILYGGQMTILSEIPAYFRVNPMYFLRDVVSRDQYVGKSDLEAELRYEYGIQHPDFSLFDEMVIDGETMVIFSRQKFYSDLRRRQFALERLFGHVDSIRFLLLFVPRLEVERQFGKIA